MILIIELPKKLAEEFSPSLTNPSEKALKDVDMYDFLDYMIGRGQQNQATSELKDALIGLKKLESSQPNPPSPNNPSNTPPSTPPTKPSKNATPSNNVDIIADKNLKQGKTMENQMEFLEISTQDTKSITELRNNASQKIDKLLGKDIINKNDGRVAQISKNGRNKILSGVALRKSRENGFSKEEHFKASEHIKELYENSTAIKSELPRNNSNDIKEVYKYISNLHINNKEAQALLTIKEIVEYGNRIYSLELQELRPVSQMQIHTK